MDQPKYQLIIQRAIYINMDQPKPKIQEAIYTNMSY